MENVVNNIINEIEAFLKNKITNQSIISLYLGIGKQLNNINNISYQNWFYIEDMIRRKYGLMICFSRRNLNYILKFYQYSNANKTNMNNLDWNTCLFILRHRNYNELFSIALQQNFNKRELEYYIKNIKIKKIEKTYVDPSFEELSKLQEKLNKYTENLI